jgi:hypothetical protein
MIHAGDMHMYADLEHAIVDSLAEYSYAHGKRKQGSTEEGAEAQKGKG